MYDVLVYLYETYYRLDACPAPAALERKLVDAGFDQGEITDALDWLSGLAKVSDEFSASGLDASAHSPSVRFFAEQEKLALGAEAIGFIHFLELAGIMNPVEREIVIERALAVDVTPMPLDQLKVIVLMTLWSAGKEPGVIAYDELSLGTEEAPPRLLH